jgi:hypothetical protein
VEHALFYRRSDPLESEPQLAAHGVTVERGRARTVCGRFLRSGTLVAYGGNEG